MASRRVIDYSGILIPIKRDGKLKDARYCQIRMLELENCQQLMKDETLNIIKDFFFPENINKVFNALVIWNSEDEAGNWKKLKGVIPLDKIYNISECESNQFTLHTYKRTTYKQDYFFKTVTEVQRYDWISKLRLHKKVVDKPEHYGNTTIRNQPFSLRRHATFSGHKSKRPSIPKEMMETSSINSARSRSVSSHYNPHATVDKSQYGPCSTIGSSHHDLRSTTGSSQYGPSSTMYSSNGSAYSTTFNAVQDANMYEDIMEYEVKKDERISHPIQEEMNINDTFKRAQIYPSGVRKRDVTGNLYGYATIGRQYASTTVLNNYQAFTDNNRRRASFVPDNYYYWNHPDNNTYQRHNNNRRNGSHRREDGSYRRNNECCINRQNPTNEDEDMYHLPSY